jgi:hypothetical protein
MHLQQDSPLYPPLSALPAGVFRLSLPDWSRYALLHLGLGPAEYLPADSLAALHQPWAPDYGES